jgi:hypothetical protein
VAVVRKKQWGEGNSLYIWLDFPLFLIYEMLSVAELPNNIVLKQ